jgi:hypothetical protein
MENTKLAYHYQQLSPWLQPVINEDTVREFFSPEGRTLVIGAPMMFAFTKKITECDYMSVGMETKSFLARTTPENGLYDSILFDCESKAPVHPMRRKAPHRSGEEYMRTAMRYLKDGGKFMAKFPVNFIIKMQDKAYTKWLDVTKLNIIDKYVFIEIIKREKTGKTLVSWNGTEAKQLDILDDIITHDYDENVYNFINNTDLTDSYRRITIDGKGSTTDVQLAIRGHNPDTSLCLFVRNTGRKPKIETFEDVCGKNIGGDFFIFPDTDTRDRFLAVFRNQLVVKFITQVSYNKYDSMKLSHKEYIFNPNTLSLL